MYVIELGYISYVQKFAVALLFLEKTVNTQKNIKKSLTKSAGNIHVPNIWDKYFFVNN